MIPTPSAPKIRTWSLPSSDPDFRPAATSSLPSPIFPIGRVQGIPPRDSSFLRRRLVLAPITSASRGETVSVSRTEVSSDGASGLLPGEVSNRKRRHRCQASCRIPTSRLSQKSLCGLRSPRQNDTNKMAMPLTGYSPSTVKTQEQDSLQCLRSLEVLYL